MASIFIEGSAKGTSRTSESVPIERGLRLLRSCAQQLRASTACSGIGESVLGLWPFTHVILYISQRNRVEYHSPPWLPRRFWWFLLVQTALLAWGTAETAVAVPRQGFGSHLAHPVTAALLLWATFTCCLLLLVTAFLLLFNAYLLAVGMTMYEYMRGGAKLGGGELEGGPALRAWRMPFVWQVLRNLRASCCPWGE